MAVMQTLAKTSRDLLVPGTMKDCFRQLMQGKFFESFPQKIQSRLVSGVTKMAEGDFDAAQSKFEQCIELDERCGTAWIGKAHAEAAINPTDGQKHISSINNSLLEARKHVGDDTFFQEQQVEVLKTLISTLTCEISTQIKLVGEYQAQGNDIQNQADRSASVAGLAFLIGNSSK